jgi:hypothetical protein
VLTKGVELLHQEVEARGKVAEQERQHFGAVGVVGREAAEQRDDEQQERERATAARSTAMAAGVRQVVAEEELAQRTPGGHGRMAQLARGAHRQAGAAASGGR